ncbi:ABC transporter substrate-binding protein [Halomicrococcus gelatinilyticus]|uniref:ABC transporter substrate-binding protein n=1 Tax=Halomicrococcus gelatinilyticus TaxID=1702103 RepID=UPI002E1190B0
MVDRFSDDATRRRFLKGGAATGAALLAGCTGDTSDGDTTTTSTTTDGTSTGATSTETTTTDGPYSVSMKPVGEVTFESVPETWVANNGSWADMGAALGVEPPKAVWLPSRYRTKYYDEIPGVSVDKSGMQALSNDGVSKELFYQLDGDVHVIDPNFLKNRFKGWEQSDVDEIEKNIAPFFGNSIFSTGYEWHDDYPYLSLYEAFEKLSKVFQRQQRYEQFAALHEEFQSKVSEVVPSSKSERPSVAIVWAGGDEPEGFYPYVIGEGTSFKQWRDLKVKDALGNSDVKDFHATRGQIDYETLLEVDPDVLLCRGHEAKTAEEFQNTVVSFLENHSTASALTAVTNGDVYRGGPLYQGPIINLVVTERAARQVYPDAMGDRKLFDRQRVADVVNGDS